MKFYLLPLLFTLTLFKAYGQSDSDWVMFIDKSTNLIGYKNLRGEVKIEPKFTYLTQQNIFRNIMPVFEKATEQGDSTLQYYLLKDGRKIGRDSLYLGEYYLDCENENKIRFRDPVSNRVGYFNTDGRVLIPAMYNDATPFYNGLAIVIRDGKKMCRDGSEFSKENPCEHWSWLGNYLLINDKNEVLLDSLDPDGFRDIDFYSMQKNLGTIPSDYVEFTSSDRTKYSFRNFNKEFRTWFNHDFLPHRNSGDFINYFFPEITIPKAGDFKSIELSDEKYRDYAWTVDGAINVLEQNRTLISNILDKVNDKNYLTSISKSHAPIILDDKLYPEYFSDCGDYLEKKYPYFEVLVTNNNGLILNGLGFIRTKEGYKLLEIY